MGQADGRCDAIKANGERCGNTILPLGSDLCMAHGRAEVLARARREARVRKAADREMRKPPPAFFAEGWDEEPFRPSRECAERFGVDRSTVTRWYAWVRYQREVERARDGLGPVRPFPESHWDLSVEHIPALLEHFLAFRGRWFRTPRGRPYLTPPFQQRWVEAILRTLVTGGRQIILSPPRHGKSELLIHVCVWLIVLFPNIRILWVGGNERIAQRSVGAVARFLASNEELAKEYLGPGGSFRPGKDDGYGWSKTEFTVGTRTHPEIKGATMTALGRGGTLLSLDADIIIADDIEDHQSTATAGARESTREWWTSQLESRKEEHTGLFMIGSRQHPDDLAGHLLDNDEYESIVETAHDEACDKPRGREHWDEHVDCMLFPEVRSFRWLMQQKRAAETAGGAQIYEMVYLNRSSAEGFQVFSAEKIHQCRNPQRTVGQIPAEATRLVAGLDPSGVGYQAAFLWAYTVHPELRMWMVDLENREGGGIAKARETIRNWWEKYRVAHWVVEENLYHGGIVDDEQIREFAAVHGIRLEGFRTYRNKLDPRLGVTSLAPLFANRQIDLPYGDGESQAKVDAYVHQLIYYDASAPRNRNAKAGYKSDLVMASWFPMEVIRRAYDEAIERVEMDYRPSYSGFGVSDWDQVPWGSGSAVPWAS